ncbi:MAG TPA: transposase, partial [Acidimicrobiia bacterium]|nr:transposase [Acidimicrobiia bacterium]
MVRRARVEVEGGVYHVYNRVASGEPVFGDPEEGLRFVEVLREVKRRDGWTVFAWCLMSNHYHLAIRTSAVPLWRGLHHVQCTFSRGFNRRRGRTGSLWQSRYQAKLVEDDRYLGRLIAYVHLNPVRAGAVSDPVEHGFGGHREIVKRVSEPLVDIDDVLLCYGESERQARRSYLSAMAAGVEAIGASPAISGGGFRSLSWSDRELQPKPGQQHVDAMGRSSGRERPLLSAERFVEEVCQLLAVEVARVVSPVKDRGTAEVRRLLAVLGVERWSQSGAGIARALGKSPDVISHWVGQGVRRRLEETAFAEKIEWLDEALSAAARGE